MNDFEVGAKKIYYQVCAYEKSENYIMDVKYFDSLKEAEDFCEYHEYSYIVYVHDFNMKCKLAIIKITSEVVK